MKKFKINIEKIQNKCWKIQNKYWKNSINFVNNLNSAYGENFPVYKKLVKIATA